MNLTLRVVTDQRSLIVKQARPWVEKYPQIPAPDERAVIEANFYLRVASVSPVASRMPHLLASDAAARVLVLEDLGERGDMTDAYAGRSICDDELAALADYLQALHRITRTTDDPGLTNRAMRKLNHAHQYVIPLEPGNGLDLDTIEPGLRAAAAEARDDAGYVQQVHDTGRRYLADGPCLLHGDFFPGSWLRTDEGPKIIDPEFGYHGDPEYDLGITIAHLILAQQSKAVPCVLNAYARTDTLRMTLLGCYAAAEVMRRLIGLAQLPLTIPSPGRAALLKRSIRAMKQNHWEALCD